MAAETAALARFERDTAEHELQVLRDDGLYRHLRFQQPGTSIYYYDLVTWPGYLAIVGDAGDYVFSRVRDMFEFFGSGGGRAINPDYWSQKLQAPRPDGARKYSHEALRARVLEWARGHCAWGEGEVVYPALLTEALEREVLWGWTHAEHEGRERLADLESQVGYIETWEWDLRDYEWSFLWCCWAIVRGIERYRAAARKEAVPHGG